MRQESPVATFAGSLRGAVATGHDPWVYAGARRRRPRARLLPIALHAVKRTGWVAALIGRGMNRRLRKPTS